jgi:psiF repeat
LNIRTVSLVCAGALCLIASGTLLTSGAVAQITIAGGVPPAGSNVTVRLVAETLPVAKQDPAGRSARSIECAQKADAQGLQGKTRKHFLHECKRGS